MDQKFFGVNFLGNLKNHLKYIFSSFFKQFSSTLQEMFLILQENFISLKKQNFYDKT